MQRRITMGFALAALAGLAGCGPNYSPNTYSASAVQQANKVERGIVIGVRNVGVSADSPVGTVTGAAAGGIGGAQLGTGGPITALTTLGGTVVGGLIGSSVEHAAGDTNAYEYIVRQDDGTLVSVTQKDKVPLEIGQTVLVIAGKQARIVPDYTVTVPNEPPVPTAKGKAPPKPAVVATPLPAPPGTGAAGAAEGTPAPAGNAAAETGSAAASGSGTGGPSAPAVGSVGATPSMTEAAPTGAATGGAAAGGAAPAVSAAPTAPITAVPSSPEQPAPAASNASGGQAAPPGAPVSLALPPAAGNPVTTSTTGGTSP